VGVALKTALPYCLSICFALHFFFLPGTSAAQLGVYSHANTSHL